MTRRSTFLKIKSGLCVLFLLLVPFYAVREVAEASTTFPVKADLVSPSRGLFLVADPKISDPSFKKTVVLLLQHGKKGTMGLIINRSTAFPLSQLLPKMDAVSQPVGILYDGGPVDRETLTLLYRSDLTASEARPIFDDVYASQEARVLAEQLQLSEGRQDFRLYAGYAGWGPEQLQREMKRGDWHLVKADAASLYERPLKRIWQEMFNRSQVLRVRSAFPVPMMQPG